MNCRAFRSAGPPQQLALVTVFGTAACALALAWLCLGSAPTFAQPTNNDYYKSAGTELLGAVEKYHLGPANDKLRAHQFESGLGDIQFILRYFPNHPQGLMLMIEMCDQWKSPRCNPQEPIENAVMVNPDVAATYVIQGIYHFRGRRLPAAIASFEKALTLEPNSLNAHYNLGLAYFETKQFELANTHAQRAYELGAPLPGLRDKLIRVGKWKPVDTPTANATSSPGTKPEVSPAPR